jgi:FkbM family methyltransferase
MSNLKTRLARLLHRLPLLRKIGKRFLRGTTMSQPFYGGVICMDAVEHAWAWAAQNNYEGFDRPLQDMLLKLSLERPWLVDIGSNLGAMTLSVLMRNTSARALAVDPNRRAQALLRESLRRNGLVRRAEIVNAAVAPVGAEVMFDFKGSVVGHVAPAGDRVASMTVKQILDRVPVGESPLIKVDIEGFETRILADLVSCASARNAVLVLELHPAGLNGFGDPVRGLEAIRSSGAVVCDLAGGPLAELDRAAFTHVVARWR